eukprot:152799_1
MTLFQLYVSLFNDKSFVQLFVFGCLFFMGLQLFGEKTYGILKDKHIIQHNTSKKLFAHNLISLFNSIMCCYCFVIIYKYYTHSQFIDLQETDDNFIYYYKVISVLSATYNLIDLLVNFSNHKVISYKILNCIHHILIVLLQSAVFKYNSISV